jgi:hypothetical protein
LDGAWRIEMRALRRDAIGAGMLAVEIWHGNQVLASGCLPVAFVEAWGNRLIEAAADLSSVSGFPNWTKPEAETTPAGVAAARPARKAGRVEVFDVSQRPMHSYVSAGG